jgi:hypothetical protein
LSIAEQYVEFIRWLQEGDLLSYDHDSVSWSCDDEEICLTIIISEVGDFLVDKLEQLPQDMKEVLKAAACLGSHVDEELIEYVLKKPVACILNEASAKGQFDMVTDMINTTNGISHDQRKAYVLSHAIRECGLGCQGRRPALIVEA